MRLILSLIFTIALSILSTGPLHGEAPSANERMRTAACNRYADVADAQNVRWAQSQCGFHPEKFATKRSAHIAWCLSVNDEDQSAELGARTKLMTKCSACRNYANEANAAARENVAFRCGFDGPGWSQENGGPDDAHFKWCMGTPERPKVALGTALWTHATKMEGETASRYHRIRECKAKVDQRFTETERNFCHDYKNKAVLHANFNANNKCGATPVGRFGLLGNDHYLWCLTMVGTEADKAVVTKEAAIRESAVSNCQRGGKLTADGGIIRPVKNIGTPKNQAATKTMEGRPSQQKQPKTSGGAGSAEDRVGSGGYDRVRQGGDSDAIRRLGGGGGYTPAYGGGSNPVRSRDSGTGPAAQKSGGAAIITPAAGPAPAQIEQRPVKQLVKPDKTIDYGSGPKAPPPPRPVK